MRFPSALVLSIVMTGAPHSLLNTYVQAVPIQSNLDAELAAVGTTTLTVAISRGLARVITRLVLETWVATNFLSLSYTATVQIVSYKGHLATYDSRLYVPDVTGLIILECVTELVVMTAVHKVLADPPASFVAADSQQIPSPDKTVLERATAPTEAFYE